MMRITFSRVHIVWKFLEAGIKPVLLLFVKTVFFVCAEGKKRNSGRGNSEGN